MTELFLRVMKATIQDGRAVCVNDPEANGPRVFVPADDDTKDRANRRKLGEVFRGKFRVYRNYKFHKKYFAVMNELFDMQEMYPTVDELRRAITIEAGEYVLLDNLDGTHNKEAKSIAFDNMNEDEFQDLVVKSVNVACEYSHVLCPANPEGFERAALQLLGSGTI